MAAKGSECNTSLNDSSDLPSRQTNSASSSIRRLSFSLPDGFDSSLNERAEIEIAPQEEDVRNPDVQNISHHQSFRRPLSVENFTVDEVGLSQSRHCGSIGRTSSLGASLRGLFSLSSVLRLPEDVESEFVSQAGDIGDRVLSNRASHRDSASFSINNGVVFPVPEELLESYGFWNHDSSKLNVHSPVSSLTSEIISSPFINALLHKKQAEGERQAPSFDYIACLVLLAAFGILGVLTRYLLQKLLGPGVADVTSDQSILYLDLPSNMVGSFLMGWFGIVFKADISRFSEQLAIGLSTGYLGSLTTFSSWNQKMLDLSVNGKWVFAVVGFVIGLFLAAYSIILGVETAKGFRWLLRRSGIDSNVTRWRVNISKKHLIVLLALLIWGGLWTTSGVLERKEFKNGGNDAQLWLGCLVSPFGVWIRWWLARLNGSGLGKAGWFKWMPFGTLITNVAAACIMAALATIKKTVNTKNCDTIATGIQFGLLGCLSTVSTFMAEFHAMRQTTHPWRSYVYAFMTIGFSFGLGTLIFSVPVWIKGYK